MAEVVTAVTAPGMAEAIAPRTTIGADLAAAGAAYDQTAAQAVVDRINDLQQLLKNVGIAK